MYKTQTIARPIATLKILFSVAVLVLIWVKLAEEFQYFSVMSFSGFTNWQPFIWGMLLLAIINLWLESKKWMSLCPEIHLNIAYKAVLKGMASGFITPNRVGELPMRVMVLPLELRTKAAAASVVGAILQGAITFVFGSIALILSPVIFELSPQRFQLPTWSWSICIVLILFGVGFIFRRKLSRHIKEGWNHIQQLSKYQLRRAVLFALCRYLVFSSQLAIALCMFGYQGSPIYLLAGIPALYFIQSYMPFSTFGELGIRELLAILIFGAFMPQPWMAPLATLSLWVFNLLLPILLSLFIRTPLLNRA